jgi:hypothetical protein
VRLLSLLEETLRNPRLEVEKKSNAFWPSEGGITYELHGRPYREGGCNRASWYRLTNQPKESRGTTFKSAIEQGFGGFVSSKVAQIAMLGRFFLGEEVPISLTRRVDDLLYSISGAIDVIVQDPISGRPILIECKTTGSAYFGQVTPTKEGKMAPSTGHVIQCLPYLEWARTEARIQDPQINIFYVERAHAAANEHIVKLNAQGQAVVENDVGITTWTDISMPALYADWDATAKAVRDGTPPDRPYTPQYSNDQIKWRYDNGMLNKTETEKIKRGLERDDDYLANEKPPVLTKGDFNCAWCPHLKKCYGSIVPTVGNNPFSAGGNSIDIAEVPI